MKFGQMVTIKKLPLKFLVIKIWKAF